ncbi:MAG: hypothetical protein KF861_01820 [Planctomycetaceae bacterium]|nr:hypothetical protein [Planctomycetaceae bacterium]
MPNWLTKASKAVSRQGDESPQEFLVVCECGQEHKGQRKSRPQRIICQTCAAALFILPRNAYPVLQPQTRKRRRRGSSGSRRNLTGVARGVGHGTAAVGRSLVLGATGAIISLVAAIVGQLRTLFAWARSQFTPFRLVLTGIVLLLAFTGLWTIRTRMLEQSLEALRIEFEAGQAALVDGDLDGAQAHFVKAAAAARRLHASDARARHARQLLHETTAMTHLASVSLLEMLEEAERTTRGPRPHAWEAQFRATYADAWVVLEAPVRRSDEGGDSQVIVEFPIVIGQGDRPVEVTATVQADVADRLTKDPQVAIFAAAVSGCALDPTGERWVVTLKADSGFLWSDAENLRRLGYFNSGWISEEETLKLLAEQSQALGVP